MESPEMHDEVAAILDAWKRERPDLDPSPVAIFGRITRIERSKSQALHPLFSRRRLDPGEYDVLAALRCSGEPYALTPTELYRTLLVTSATMTERADRLERRGLVRRRPSPSDRRSILIVLTTAGRRCIDRAATELVALEHELLRPLNAQQRRTLADLLAVLDNALAGSDQRPA